jgi:ComF family protein
MYIIWMQYFKNLAVDLFHLLFPNLCNACGQSLVKSEQFLCLNCLFDLPYTDFHLFRDNQVARQFWGRFPCTYAMAMLYFRKGGKVQQILHSLKYRGKAELGVLLGKLLAERMMKGNFPNFDIIIAVPLHWKKEKLRGYNQSQCIAEGLGTVMNIPVVKNVLVKKKSTSSQTKKGRFDRFENLKEAFAATNTSILENKHVLLVDDVVTTGATLEACALVLLEAGVKTVSISTVAYVE